MTTMHDYREWQCEIGGRHVPGDYSNPTGVVRGWEWLNGDTAVLHVAAGLGVTLTSLFEMADCARCG